MLRGVHITSTACLALLLAVPSSASACGGMFCDAVTPVNQQAERIIFAPRPGGGVSAVIEIQYVGPSERFAWVLPVTGSPNIAVSSTSALDALQRVTNPSYVLNTIVEGECSETSFADGAERGAPAAAGDAGLAAGDGSVSVVDQGTVGPYDFQIISVDPSVSPRADIAVDWLQTNGYDVDDSSAALLEPYLEQGQNLLAFRLTKGNDSGSIRPVIIDFGPGLPSIPIRPTAVAAERDMGVMVWVLGQTRAIPVNYRALELNEALINWFNPSSNYDDVINAAADEAGGQGFATEMAGSSMLGQTSIWSETSETTWRDIRDQDGSSDAASLLRQLAQMYGNFDGMREVFETHTSLDEADLDRFLQCPFCTLPNEVMIADRAALFAAMETSVIEPVRATAALFDSNPYMTRLYTTMSPAEMTMDPVFDYNSDLPDYDNSHIADRVIECSPDVNQFDAPWRVELNDGVVVRGTGRSWPTFPDDMPMPANARVLRIGTTGTGEVVTDNLGMIQSALSVHNATVPSPTFRARGGLSCSVGMGRAGVAPLLLGAIGLGLALMRRRR